MKKKIIITLLACTLIFSSVGYLTANYTYYGLGIITLLLLVIAIENTIQKRHSILRNYPILGIPRWILEELRDKIRQYFIDSDTDEVPFSREQRSIVYQRSKGDAETVPFGTIHNVYEEGHEYIAHKNIRTKPGEIKDRFLIGSKHCDLKYSSSIMNISDMSWGSLSGAAIRALNLGAKKGGFLHSTGEGGVSSHHLQGGDLCFQIGTGYFGAGKTVDGQRVFCEKAFLKSISHPSVKMVEIKLSQGAKPGHGGMLPAVKNTKDIAKVRGVEAYTDVYSPGYHSAFSDIRGMVEFIQKLRSLSGGKPIGIKLCMGDPRELHNMCREFKRMDNYPDYISIDGSEGGTGSAPYEFTNFVGTPLMYALREVDSSLRLNDLRDEIKVFASGKVSNAFDIIRLLAMGADGVKVARSFMLSLGCIQARICNTDKCPVGVATQNKNLESGLIVEDKYKRVFNYHNRTIEEVKKIAAIAGVTNLNKINKRSIYRIVDGVPKSLHEIYKT